MTVPVMLLLTIGAYLLGVWIRKKSGISMLTPLFIALPVIVTVLLLFDIPCDFYMNSNSVISFMLGPCVVSLGVKLYDNRRLVSENILPIATAVLTGSVVGVLSVIVTGRMFGLPDDIILTLEPKSVTTPIAMDIVASLGGNISLIAVSVVLAGFLGNVLGPWFLDFIRVKDPVARGAAMGCSSHGLGTARAIEESALEGAVSGLCIGLMGVVTAIVVPVFSL